MPDAVRSLSVARTRHARALGFAMTLALAVTATVLGSDIHPAPAAPPTDGTAGLAFTLDKAAVSTQLEQLAEEMMVPGAAVLIRTPEGEVSATFGTTELGGVTPVSLDDHVRVGSNTKTWTATAILQLVQEGKIALADPVSHYRPDVPNGENITVKELLNMTSGLFNYTETYYLNYEMDTDPQRAWDPEQLVALGVGLPPDFAPGTSWHYSNTNYILLGLIAEQIEDKPLQQIFHERLFTPLGLTETSFPALDDSSIPAPYSRGYMYTDNVRTLATSVLPADVLAEAEAGSLLPNDQTNVNPSWAWSAGSGISTIGDLATWVEAMGSGALLEPELQQQRLTDLVVTANGEAAYGMGIAQLGPLFGHTGELPGYNSFMGYDPVNEVTVVVWANLAPVADGRAPATTIARAFIDDLYGLEPVAPSSDANGN
jgi:D-alanyl-D-alanine carboxypeptidase